MRTAKMALCPCSTAARSAAGRFGKAPSRRSTSFYVKDGAIVVHEGSNFPTWLRSEKQYENFDFRCEFFIKGWMNSGLLLHAPEHGCNTWIGMKVNIFHKQDEHLLPESIGSIFPLVPPL